MSARFERLLLVMCVLLLAACTVAPDAAAPTLAGGQPESQPAEAAPPPLEEQGPPVAQPGQGGVVSSDGSAQSSPPLPAGQISLPGSPPSEPFPTIDAAELPQEGAPAMPQPASWQTYTDAQYSFAVSYPDTHVILPETQAPGAIAPGMVQQINIMEQGTAASEFAQYTPPDLAVQVFEAGGLTLEEWLDANEPGSARTARSISGKPGYKVVRPTQLAPNEFFYVAAGGYIYRVAPLGEQGMAMLPSFTLR